MRLEKKHELILLRLRYLKKELDFVKQTFDVASEEFLEEYKRKVTSLPDMQKEKIKKSLNKEKKRRETDARVPPPQAKKALSESVKEKHAKKLFKEVAKVSHPDAIIDSSEEEKSEKEKLFKKAQQAVEGSKYFELLEVAEELGVEIPPPTTEGLLLLKESVRGINKEIKDFKKTYSWIWYHSENTKVQIMSKYIASIISGNIRT